MSKVLELISKPFFPSNYFQNNERMIIDKSLSDLIESMGPSKIIQHQLGYLEAKLKLKATMNDLDVLKTLHEINCRVQARVSFLDIALHVESKFELDDYQNVSEVSYVGGPSGQLFSIFIKAVETDSPKWKIKLSSSIFNKKNKLPFWAPGTVFLLKKFN